jgi:hypothetical protein
METSEPDLMHATRCKYLNLRGILCYFLNCSIMHITIIGIPCVFQQKIGRVM